jgi:hypothetical protein
MNWLLFVEVYMGITAALVMALFAGVAWDWLRDMDAQRRMDTLIAVEAARFAEDAEVRDLDALWALPARRHP